MAELPQLFMRLPRLAPDWPDGDGSELAGPEDAAAIAALISAAFEEDWDAGRAARELGPDEGVDASYVVRQDGGVVAVASARHMSAYPDAGYLHYVAADSSRAGRGLGTVVTAAVLQHFAHEGLDAVVLETDDFRLPAIRTYLKLGFVPEYRHEEDQARWSRIIPLVLGPSRSAAGQSDG